MSRTSRPAVARPTRRTVLTLASATTATGLLAACGGGGDTGGGALGGGDGLTIVVPTSQAPWNPAYAAIVQQYQDETGNRVELREFPNDEVKTQQINDIRGGGTTFDVFQVNEADLAQFATNGWLRPFDDVESGYTLDPAVYTYNGLPYWKQAQQVFAEDGQLVSVPLNGNLEIFMYRKDLYDQLGLQVPQTWDDVVANGDAIKESGAVQYGGAYRLQGVAGAPNITYDFQAIMAGLGVSFFAAEGTDWTPTLDTPEALQAATILRRLALHGPEATTTMGQAQAIAAMQAGTAGQTYLVAAAAPQLESEADSNIVGQVGYAPLPAGPSGARTASGIWSLAVPAGLPDDRAQAALDFITYVTSKDAQTRFAAEGGIPIRSDIDTSGLSEDSAASLDAVQESAEDAVGQTRYVFAADFLNITEPALAAVAAGAATPEAGLAQLQTDLMSMVQSLGLPAAG